VKWNDSVLEAGLEGSPELLPIQVSADEDKSVLPLLVLGPLADLASLELRRNTAHGKSSVSVTVVCVRVCVRACVRADSEGKGVVSRTIM